MQFNRIKPRSWLLLLTAAMVFILACVGTLFRQAKGPKAMKWEHSDEKNGIALLVNCFYTNIESATIPMTIECRLKNTSESSIMITAPRIPRSIRIVLRRTDQDFSWPAMPPGTFMPTEQIELPAKGEIATSLSVSLKPGLYDCEVTYVPLHPDQKLAILSCRLNNMKLGFPTNKSHGSWLDHFSYDVGR